MDRIGAWMQHNTHLLAWVLQAWRGKRGLSPVFLVASLLAASAAWAYPVNQCASDRVNSDLGCTANDVSISSIAVAPGSPSSCVGGTSLNLDLDVTINAANAKRYDIGVFLANDGKTTRSQSSNGGAATCSVAVVPKTPLPFSNLSSNNNACGDIDGPGSGTFRMSGVTVLCSGGGSTSGNLTIPFLVSWDVDKNATCASSADPAPSAQSKCNAPTIYQTVAVVVLPTITMTDGLTSIHAGATTSYTVVVTNTTGIALAGAVFKDPAVTGLTANSVSCTAAGGATCPTGPTVAAMQGAGITIPSMPIGSSVTFTIGATVAASATGSITNTASVSVGGQSNTAADTDTVLRILVDDDKVQCPTAGYTTIGAALNYVKTLTAGTYTVTVCTGTYSETLTLDHANHAGLTLTSATGNAADVTIQHPGSNPWRSEVIVSQPNVTISGVNIKSLYAYAAVQVDAAASGFILSAASASSSAQALDLRAANPHLTDVTVSTSGDWVGAIYLNGASGLVMDGTNTITATGNYGSAISDPSNASVAANPTISGTTATAKYQTIYLNKAGTINFSNSTVTSSGGHAMYLLGGSGAQVFNNLSVTGNSGIGHGLYISGGTSATFTDVDASSIGGGGAYGAALAVKGISGAVTIGRSSKSSIAYTATGSNTYGIFICAAGGNTSAVSISGATVNSTLDGIHLDSDPSCGNHTASFANLSVASSSYSGITVGKGTGNHSFNYITSTGIGPNGYGIALSGGTAATFTDVDASVTGSGNWTAALGISGISGGTVNIGTAAKSTIQYTATSPDTYGILFCGASSAKLTVANATISSTQRGIYANSSCSNGATTLNNLTVTSSTSHSIEVNAGGAHSFNSITATGAQHGIYVNGGSNATYANLTVTSGNDGSTQWMSGLYLGTQSGATLSGVNTFAGKAPSNTGIYLNACTDCTIGGSTVDMNSKTGSSGVNIANGSSNAAISGNYVKNASFYGITTDSLNTTVTGNIVENSAAGTNWVYGIYMGRGNGVAYNNCLYNDTNAAGKINGRSEGAAFYSGTAGNFWGSWPKGSGYSETCADTDNDGKCDTRYNYYGSYYDNYPLKKCDLSGPTATPALVTEYRMDESSWSGAAGEVKDNVGALHGTAQNGATTASAKLCNGGSFDGSDDRVQLPTTSTNFSAGVSIAAWVQPKGGSNWEAIVDLGNGQENDNIVMYRRDNSNKLAFKIYNGSTWCGEAVTASDVLDGQMRHFTATIDASMNVKLYRDGSPVSISGSPFTCLPRNTTRSTNQIGRSAWSGDSPFKGIIDELKIWDGALSSTDIQTGYTNEAAGKNWDGTARTCATSLTCVAPLDSATFSSDWFNRVVSGSFTPKLVDGSGNNCTGTACRLRLTNTTASQATQVSYTKQGFPFGTNKVTAEFDYWAYGGNGADGIGVVFSDPNSPSGNNPPTAGAFGGSLGYAQKGATSDCPNCPGFTGGWVGIGIDEYGNFSNSSEGRVGGPGSQPNAIAARKAGSGTSGYDYLAGASVGSVASGNSSTPYRYRITLDGSTSGGNVTVERNTGSGFSTVLNTATGTIPPALLQLSFTGSTGVSTNIHEIANLQVCYQKTSGLTPFHHIEIQGNASGVTCIPNTLTIKACDDANTPCTAYTKGVTGKLSATGTPTVSWDGATGGDAGAGFVIPAGDSSVTKNVLVATPGSVTFGIESTTPTYTGATICNFGSPSCTFTAEDSGFVFDVPTLTSNKTSDSVSISAVGKDTKSQNCVPMFKNVDKTVNFWSTYDIPNTGTKAMSMDGTVVGTLSTTSTGITLKFDANGQSSFKVAYADAGKLQLNAKYTEGSLIMQGNDSFVVKPAGLCIYSTDSVTLANCPTGSTSWDDARYAGCDKKVKAGSTFNLTVRAVAWESDTDIDLCATNATTPNYQAKDITLGSVLVAPSSGDNGSLSETSIEISADKCPDKASCGWASVNQSISEVGVFKFSATPPKYIDNIDLGGPFETNAFGRFFPVRLGVSANTPAFGNACTATTSNNFTYLGQEFDYATAPELTVTAKNKSGGTTKNYGGSFWKLAAPGSLDASAYASTASGATSLSRTTAGSFTLSGTGDYDGVGTLAVSDDKLTYAKPASGGQAPFDANVTLTVPAGKLTDTDGVCYDKPKDDGTYDGNCDAYAIADITGAKLRHGRARMLNANGSELLDLPVPFRTEYWLDANSGWKLNSDDSCTDVTLAFTAVPNNTDITSKTCVWDDQGKSGKGCSTTPPSGRQFKEKGITGFAGDFNLWLKAPGVGNTGTLDVSATVPDWLKFNYTDSIGTIKARATFGIYKSGPVIYRREIIGR